MSTDYIIPVRDFVINQLKKTVVKAALKKFLSSGILMGFRGWLISFIVEELFEAVAEPIIKLAFRKLGYLYNRANGEIILKKLHQAETNHNEDDYRNTIGDL